jgi:hypothetical protein
VVEFSHLWDMPMEYLDIIVMKARPGRYVCTFDFLNNGFSEFPEQHKHLHFIKLEDGNYALMPNNRVKVRHQSFTEGNGFSWGKPPRIKTNTLIWHAEV